MTFAPALNDRAALVTGGGRGFGRLIAEALAARGAQVLITSARQPEEMDWIAASPHAPRLHAVQSDVRDPAACQRAVRVAEEAFGRLDILVNNAGRARNNMPSSWGAADWAAADQRSWMQEAEVWREVVETNLNGPFFMAQAALPGMLARGFGRIISISTSRVTMALANIMPYGATKAGLEAWTRGLAGELAGTGVTANIVLPGGASDTAFIPSTGYPDRDNLLPADIIVPPCLYLASEEGGTLNGARLVGKLWRDDLPPAEAAQAAQEAGVEAPVVI